MQLLIKSILALTFLCWQPAAPGKLSDSKWTGSLTVPQPADGMLEFKNDTMYVRIDNQIIETMSYQEKGDTLILKKLNGESNCGEVSGQYRYLIKENILKLTVLKDDCAVRAGAFTSEGYKKQTN